MVQRHQAAVKRRAAEFVLRCWRVHCRMEFEHEQREALRILHGIENGIPTTTEVALLLEQADAALVHLIFAWLRSHYHSAHPAADGVLGRLVEVSSASRTIKTKMREGKDDPIVEWFEDEHGYRDFGAVEFIALIVEKIEG
jgi:hypothetical protein